MSDLQPVAGAKFDLTGLPVREWLDLRAYLDDKIREWRGSLQKRLRLLEIAGREHVASESIAISCEKAIAYVDAYRTMRTDLFGKPLEDGA